MQPHADSELFDPDFLARLERLRLAAKALTARGSVAMRRSRRVGDGLEFADHRDYVPGDETRFIDWAYYARMERLLLRLFHEHSEAGVSILLDISSSMAPAGETTKFRYTLRSAAALAYVAMSALDQVWIVPFAESLQPARRLGRQRVQILAAMDYLASLQPGGRTDLPGCLERYAASVQPGQTVLLISDLLAGPDELLRGLRRLRGRRCDVAALHLYTPQEADPPLDGPVSLQDAETGQTLELSAGTQLLDAYRRRWQAWREQIERTCIACGAVYVPARTDVALEKLVLEMLRQARVVEG